VLSAIFLLGSVQLAFREKFDAYTYAAGSLLFAAALFTYEQSILWPVAALWLAFYSNNPFKKSRLYYAACLFVVAVVYAVVRRHISAEVVGSYEGGQFKQGHVKVLVQNMASLLLRQWLNPSAVKVFVVSAGVVLTVVLAGVLWRFKQVLQAYKSYLFFIGMNLLLLLPVVSLGITIRSFESSRYLYLPSLFMLMGLALWLYRLWGNAISNKWPTYLLTIALCVYWLVGKSMAYKHYTDAGNYVRAITQKTGAQAALLPNDTIYIDKLRITIHRLPVFRMGFNTGMQWLYPGIDTGKIVVKYRYDEFLEEP
jgi:hypothetical protein